MRAFQGTRVWQRVRERTTVIYLVAEADTVCWCMIFFSGSDIVAALFASIVVL